jgi:signal transduction histidine kinase/CheY-like chemotaxis protein
VVLCNQREREEKIRSSQPSATPWLVKVRHEQTVHMYRNGLVTIPVTLLAGGVLIALLQGLGVVPPVAAWTWLALLALQSAGRVGLLLAWKRAAPRPADWRRWAQWFMGGVLVGGILWGVGTLFLMPPGRFDLQLVILLTITALVYGSIASFGGWLPAFYAFLFPALAPSVIWSLLQGDVEHVAYAVLALIWIPAIAVLGFRYSHSLERSISLGFENAALAEDARRQKAAAEEANAAKSRFLASASHDLRQPVHALGLFAGALRHEQLPPRAAELAAQIDGAVETLDKLFIALLDVSRLDAGVVNPEPRAIDAGAMLSRLAMEMRPVAEAKGIEVRTHAPAAWIRSDPILLERVVRNLMSNAVRYTSAGSVLIAVRAAGRAEAAIEVWDTGPGIPDDQRERVFEEFYRPRERQGDGQGGLGLGLAIVRRLCRLMGHSLDLRSRPGHGSVFRIRVPITAAPTTADAPPAEPQIAPGSRVWVIDDDPTIRVAMEALLGSWGHQVTTGASSDDMLAHLDRDPRSPHAILCDWRLESEDGVTAIRRLQAKFTAPVPAALITGDTDPERLREATASGLPLLHKPVARAPLRALIGNLVRLNAEQV